MRTDPTSDASSPGKPELVDLSSQKRKQIIIGRGVECDVVIRDAKASRKHCRLTRGEGSFLLEDMGSSNGTYVNGERITGPATLQPNQTFKIGDTVFYLSPVT